MENKLPITRVSKFFGQEDFDLGMRMSQEYLHGDINMKLVLYRVDRAKTPIDNVYGEVGKDNIKFLPPIEFNGLVSIAGPENKSYDGGLMRYLEPGNLMVSVFINHLNELNVDIVYGDYIAYPESEGRLRYYTVANDGKVTSDNKHMYFGYKPYYRTIICVPTQENEFRGI